MGCIFKSFSKLWIVFLSTIVFQICIIQTTSEIIDKTNRTELKEARLLHDILKNYDKDSRPVEHDQAVTIHVHLEIGHIDLDEFSGRFTINGHLVMDWHDPRLRWGGNELGEMLFVSEHEIWTPDIVPYNSALKSKDQYYGNAMTYIYNNGNVTWIPHTRLQIFCEINARYWPFDTHKCTLVIGSWTYSEWQMDIQIKDTNRSLINKMVQNNEWDVTEINTMRNTKFYSCCEAPYVSIFYNITVARRSSTYKIIVFTPTASLIIMTLASFWLPPQSGEKIVLNGVSLVGVVMFLRYFADQLPALSLSTPLIVTFYSSTLVLVAMSMLISVAVLAISKTKHTRQVPLAIRSILKSCFGKLLGVANLKSRLDESELKEQHAGTSKTTETSILTQEFYRSDWVSFAIAVDRTAFVFYCISFVIMIISMYL